MGGIRRRRWRERRRVALAHDCSPFVVRGDEYRASVASEEEDVSEFGPISIGASDESWSKRMKMRSREINELEQFFEQHVLAAQTCQRRGGG